MATIVSVGHRQMDLHSGNVSTDPRLHVGYLDYPPTKRSFHVSFYGRANECAPLSVNAKIQMMSRSRTQRKRNPSPIPSLNQCQSWTLIRTTRTR